MTTLEYGVSYTTLRGITKAVAKQTAFNQFCKTFQTPHNLCCDRLYGKESNHLNI